MLTQSRANRLRTLSAKLVVAFVTFPLTSAFADDPAQTNKATPKSQPSAGAQPALVHGRVTDEAGAPLADVRVRVTAMGDPAMRVIDASTNLKQLEVRSDAKGNYRLELPRIKKRTLIVIDAVKPGYCSLRGPLMARGDTKRIELLPGAAVEPTFRTSPFEFPEFGSGLICQTQPWSINTSPCFAARTMFGP